MDNNNLNTELKNQEDNLNYPTCESCGWENKNFPGSDNIIICTPCQFKNQSDHEHLEHCGC